MKYFLFLFTLYLFIHQSDENFAKKIYTVCHTVRKGDTLSKVFKKLVINKRLFKKKYKKRIIKRLKRANPKIKNWNRLKIGEIIYLPVRKKYRASYSKRRKCYSPVKKKASTPIIKNQPVVSSPPPADQIDKPSYFDLKSIPERSFFIVQRVGANIIVGNNRGPASNTTFSHEKESEERSPSEIKEFKLKNYLPISSYFDMGVGPGFSYVTINQTGDFGKIEGETYAVPIDFLGSFTKEDWSFHLSVSLYKADFGKVIQAPVDYRSIRLFKTSFLAGYKGLSIGGSFRKIPYAKVTTNTNEINFSTLNQQSINLDYKYNNFSFLNLSKSMLFSFNINAGWPIHVSSSKYLNSVDSYSGYNYALSAGVAKILNKNSKTWAMTFEGNIFYSYNELTIKGKWDESSRTVMSGKATIKYTEIGSMLKLSFLF